MWDGVRGEPLVLGCLSFILLKNVIVSTQIFNTSTPSPLLVPGLSPLLHLLCPTLLNGGPAHLQPLTHSVLPGWRSSVPPCVLRAGLVSGDLNVRDSALCQVES
jgi:hypothetical protein